MMDGRCQRHHRLCGVEYRERLNELTLQATTEQMDAAKAAILQMLELLQKVPPFHLLEQEYYKQGIEKVFSEAYLQNCLDYLTAIMEQQYSGIIQELLRRICTTASAPRRAMRPLSGSISSTRPYWMKTTPSWMSAMNITTQYAVATIPGKKTAQFVEWIHYVFRSDLFEGLCNGHAPNAPKKRPRTGAQTARTGRRHPIKAIYHPAISPPWNAG